jgi:predicted transcriptional regulator
MAFSRVTVTIPRDVLTAADRRARELGRSRSWVVTEALRAYGRAPVVREADAPVYAVAEVAAARRRHLDANLRLPVAERLRRAEELARLRPLDRRSVRRQIIAFDSYEDFYEWKKARRAGA